MSKREMVELLLEAFDHAVAEGDGEQIQIWMNRVTSALAAAGMSEEHEAWLNALEHTHFRTSDYVVESSMIAHAETMRAILLGIRDKVERTEPSEELFPMEIVAGTRSYIERIAAQANGCYQHGWYDACAVMIRRLIEILIIDCFEKYNIASKIEDTNGDYYGLAQLIGLFLKESSWHIPRTVKRYLPKLKDLKEIGDTAAHGRHLITTKQINDLSKAVTYTFQGLVEIAFPQD